MKIETKAVHAGTYQEQTLPANSPIFTSSTHYFTHEGECAYPRYYNMPAQEIVANKIAALENAESALLYSSGMAAIAAMFDGLFKAGDHLIVQADIYGGTHHFITKELVKWGITVTFVDANEVSEIEAAANTNTKGIYIETPSNPLLSIINVAQVAELARKHGWISMIDNTFASPINQQPINLGIDLVMHSGTKYMGGHSDLIFGVIVGSKNLVAKLKEHSVNFGPCLNGATCGLIERSLKTLAVRVKQHNENALWLAEQLQTQSFIKKVNYPGLKSHPGHELAKKQMLGFGGMMSFELNTTLDGCIKFMQNLKVILPAVSLGGVESLISSPVFTSHSKIGADGRAKMGINDNLLRYSVGIENKEDLLSDIQQAFSSI